MGYITKDYYDRDMCKINFKGWTHFNNPDYKDFADTIYELSTSGREDLAMWLKNFMEDAEYTLAIRCKDEGIKFDGWYHQGGDFGTPIFEITGLGNWSDDKTDLTPLNGLYKWTCTLRYWGQVMVDAGFAETYMDWAWGNHTDPVYPNEIEGEPLIKLEAGIVADAYDPESDRPLG